MHNPKLHIAIPLMDEDENLESLLHCIRNQSYTNYKLWIIVNQPENYWDNPEKQNICLKNATTLSRLSQVADLPLMLLDYASKGKGWKGKNIGVGIARKTVMEAINAIADPKDILLSLDGDTTFNENYFHSVAKTFAFNPQIPALSIPYYHPLTDNEYLDRAILRYEIYMRHYRLNMSRVGSPYNYTALGSAMACTLETYRRIGGMTPKKSGEDFYFLQKITKYKPLLLWNNEKVFPAARFSNRVFFGTGPAMIKGASGNWRSYPIYHINLFDAIGTFIQQFPQLYSENLPNIGDEVFGRGWTDNLRDNAASEKAFIRACHHKFDGLRSLQYLKLQQDKYPPSDEINFKSFIEKFYPKLFPVTLLQNLNFATSSIDTLDKIRNILVEIDDADLRH